MKRMFIVCVWLAAAAASCEGTGGGPARSPIGAFGTEATIGGTEPTGGELGGGGTLLALCERACANIASCEAGGASDCPAACAGDLPAGCENEYRAFVQCLATAQICVNGSLDPSACTAAILAVDACASNPTGGGSGAGTGAAGATGTSGAPAR
jgi:hypothetical protein